MLILGVHPHRKVAENLMFQVMYLSTCSSCTLFGTSGTIKLCGEPQRETPPKYIFHINSFYQVRHLIPPPANPLILPRIPLRYNIHYLSVKTRILRILSW